MKCCDINKNYVEVSPIEMRVTLPAFKDTKKYTDTMLCNVLELAQQYISPLNFCNLQGKSRKFAIYLMAGHVQILQDNILSGNASNGFQTSASIDRVSVSVAPPPIKSQMDYWLSQTPYGQQLLALLEMHTAMGFYVGGSKENVFID